MISPQPHALLSTLLVLALSCVAPGYAARADTPPAAHDADSQAQTTLTEGQTLLRHNRADQALPLFEAALKQFTDAGDQIGAAAAHDALGDVYLREGQADAALAHYQAAADSYRAWREWANADLMFAKLGEAYYLAGRMDEARAAFAQIGRQRDNTTVGGLSGRADERSNNSSAGSITFAALSASFFPGLSCAAFNTPPGTQPQPPANPDSAHEPQFRGHAPNGLDGIGRMDLYVTDEEGNPVPGVDAKLTTDRPNGIHCECTNVTDSTGRTLMNPIHVGHMLKLHLKANGFESLETIVDPQALGALYHVMLQHKGAGLKSANTRQPSTGVGSTNNATNQVNSAANALNSARACFALYALFNSYAHAELGLGRLDFERGQLNSAQTHFENLLAATSGAGAGANLLAARLYRAVARTNLGDIALKQGRFADAVKFYTQAADGARQDNRLELAWAAERGLGRTRWLQANDTHDLRAAFRLRDEARNAYRAALDEIESLFAGSLRGDEARTSFLAHTKDVFDEAASVSAEMSFAAAAGQLPGNNQAFAHAPAATQIQARPALSGPALAYAVEAFRITEEGRARALLDLLSETHTDIRTGVPAALLQARADNLARQQEIAAQLTGVSATNSVPDQSIIKLEAELDRLTAEAGELENQLRVASPRYNTLMHPQPLTLAEVQTQVLDDNTVLLEYALGSERSYLWVVTRNNGLMLYRLPAAQTIEQQVTALRDQLIPKEQRRSIVALTADDERGLRLGGQLGAPQNVQAFANAAYALYQTVVAPAAQTIAAKRLLVVADGALNYIPFQALTSAPTGTDFAGLAYLVETNEIIYAPSASVVAAIRQQARAFAAERGQGLLIIADPVFDANDPRVQNAGVLTARGGTGQLALTSALSDVLGLKIASLKLVRLAGTRAEAEQIAQLAQSAGAPTDVWLDLDASEGNVEQRDLSRYRVLHIATHGLLDTERPQFTGLALAPAGARPTDGFLRVGEVFNLRLGSPLVILSACETGLGKERRGEGVIGLTRAFMYAGAPAVGVSLWAVADRSTAELMPDFYRRLLAGHNPPAAALRAAQQQLIANRHYSAPFYWAPFVLVGDWQ